LTIKVFLAGERVGPKLERSLKLKKKKVLDAERGAAKDVVAYVVPKARADIAGAGKFGGRWTSGFRGSVKSTPDGVHVLFTMPTKPPMKFWPVFQKGATIRGKPMLWIPLSFAKDAQGVLARDFPGGLFRVDRKKGGAPLLLSRADRQPKYFGKTSVRIPKKFHLVEIIREGAKKLGPFYRARMKKNG
jgi:hypothetical protein